MSLTLEEVRRVRFRMARRGVTGYDVADVDNFIDKVEESFGQFENERDLLRREAQSAGGQGEAAPAADPQELAAKEDEIANLRAEVERLNAATMQQPAVAQPQQQPSDNGEVAELNGQNEQLRAELSRVRTELDELRTQRVSEISGQAEHITVGTREEASPAVIRLVQLATEQAEQLVAEADQETQRKLSDAKQQAYEITTDARTKAERIESEARVNAEQLRREAEENAARVNTEADARRVELFADLEREQGELTGKVDSLREFEFTYRENLRTLLSRNLSALDQENPEPSDVPELAQQHSETPRLDALAHGSEQ